jgi:hypothetical protein
MSFLALQGMGLFLFIPLVLTLYLQQPLGPAWSLSAGLAVMLGHRFIASPWMAAHSTERCLWCGRTGAQSESFAVQAGGRSWPMAACSPAHRDFTARFLGFVFRFRALVAAGIFIPLLLLLAGTLAIAAGRPFISHETNRLIFRTVVALTVAGASVAWLAFPRPAAGAPVRCPFPLHNLFLLGIANTLWVFRIVGVVWLGLTAAWLVRGA